MPFAGLTGVGPIHWGQNPSWEIANFWGCPATEKHWEPLLWCIQQKTFSITISILFSKTNIIENNNANIKANIGQKVELPPFLHMCNEKWLKSLQNVSQSIKYPTISVYAQ